MMERLRIVEPEGVGNVESAYEVGELLGIGEEPGLSRRCCGTDSR